MSLLSVVIPAYNEGAMIHKTAEVVSSLLSENNIEYEIIFVNDGSKDTTWEEIVNASANNKNIKGVCFSRNFGKEGAVFAGLEHASGDCCVVMDCDLQHPPKTILEMYKLWTEGFEVVEGVKASRGKESFIHKMFVKTFYNIISGSTGIDMSRASDFKLLDRKVVDSFLALPERHVFFRALSSWVGYKTAYVEFDVQERELGESKWSFKSLVKYAINNITSFSAAPMQLVTGCGIIFFIFAVIFGVYSIVKYLLGYSLEGFTTVILLMLIIGGILMFSLGIIGYYISKIYEEIQLRPRYIVSETTNGLEIKKINKHNKKLPTNRLYRTSTVQTFYWEFYLLYSQFLFLIFSLVINIPSADVIIRTGINATRYLELHSQIDRNKIIPNNAILKTSIFCCSLVLLIAKIPDNNIPTISTI